MRQRTAITHKLLPSETVLDDDHPILQGGIYIVDGVVRRYHGSMSTTVAEWKQAMQYKEVRRFEFGKRRDTGGAMLGDRMEAP